MEEFIIVKRDTVPTQRIPYRMWRNDHLVGFGDIILKENELPYWDYHKLAGSPKFISTKPLNEMIKLFRDGKMKINTYPESQDEPAYYSWNIG